MKTIYKYLILVLFSCLASVYIYSITKKDTKIVSEKEYFNTELSNNGYNCSSNICTTINNNNNITIDLNETIYIKHYSNSNIYITYNFKTNNGNVKILSNIFLFTDNTSNGTCDNDLCFLATEAYLNAKEDIIALLNNYQIDINKL